VCDRICALNFGKTIASGTRDEVRNDPSVVEAYLGAGTDEPSEDGPDEIEPADEAIEVNQP